METILKIYFSINFFIAGYNYSENVNWATNKKDINKAYLLVLFSVFLGLAFIAGAALLLPLKKFWDYCNAFFQIAFWFDFYVLNKYNNMNLEDLERVNRIGYLKNTNSFKHKVYRLGVKLINKRNKYTYSHRDAAF